MSEFKYTIDEIRQQNMITNQKLDKILNILQQLNWFDVRNAKHCEPDVKCAKPEKLSKVKFERITDIPKDVCKGRD